MKGNWVRCPKDKTRGVWAAMHVSLNRDGHICLTKRTWERFGAPKAVHLLFDKANQRIGLQATALGIRDAYAIGPSGPRGGKMIRAYRLLQEFNIDVRETLEFPELEIDIDIDGIMILDLRTAAISRRSANNHMRKRSPPHAALRPDDRSRG